MSIVIGKIIGDGGRMDASRRIGVFYKKALLHKIVCSKGFYLITLCIMDSEGGLKKIFYPNLITSEVNF